MMEAVLEAAVARGIVSPGQARDIGELAREISAQEPAAAPSDTPVDDEQLRFISGFGDIFVTIGLVLFLGAAAYFLGLALGLPAAAGCVAALAWALAEYFTRLRRMALPSIVLLVVFGLASFAALAGALIPPGAVPERSGLAPWGIEVERPLSLAAAALLTAALVALHYWRFRVPITWAAGAGALAAAAIALVSALAPDFAAAYLPSLVLACGLAIFALGMRFDLSDPLRQTRRTDIAFWLNLLAAPLIVHPLVAGMIATRGFSDMGTAASVLAAFLALGFVAVLIDRRAMLVSGLTYAGVAFGTIMRGTGFTDQVFPATLLVLGAFVLLLSAGWRPLRRSFLKALPARLAARLPHPMASS